MISQRGLIVLVYHVTTHFLLPIMAERRKLQDFVAHRSLRSAHIQRNPLGIVSKTLLSSESVT
jgi:hypothetical protein